MFYEMDMFQLPELITKPQGIAFICQHKPSWVGEQIPIIKKYKRRALIRYKEGGLTTEATQKDKELNEMFVCLKYNVGRRFDCLNLEVRKWFGF